MKFVVDANVLFSFFKKESFTRNFIISHPEIRLYAPVYVFEELDEHGSEIKSKSRIGNEIFELTKQELQIYITVLELDEFKEFWEQAKQLSPDPDDSQYFAAALSLDCPIWSNDGKLTEQTTVKIFSTTDLAEIFGE